MDRVEEMILAQYPLDIVNQPIVDQQRPEHSRLGFQIMGKR